MHDTAYEHGRLFFDSYGSGSPQIVVELGSQDVNGSLRDHCPAGTLYIGLDMVPAKGVDVVVAPGKALPIGSDSVDLIVTSSAFEHDVCFWDTFLELVRILRPGGFLYVNAPSNDSFHRFPLDCWRFYPDAGVALVEWATRRGLHVTLIESFVAMPKADAWADFVAVFQKSGGTPVPPKGRIADNTAAINIFNQGMQTGAPLKGQTVMMPDMQAAAKLATALRASEAGLDAATQTIRQQSNDASRAQTLQGDLLAARTKIAGLERALKEATQAVEFYRASTSWRLTGGLRWLATTLRGR